MSRKFCPHCLKKVPLRKRWALKCPHCFREFRRRSGLSERGVVGQYFEDRGIVFWFFTLTVILGITSVSLQLSGNPDLLYCMDHHPIVFFATVCYLSLFFMMFGKIFFPLLLGAPKILRKERTTIRQFRMLTGIGFLLGILLALALVGPEDFFYVFPGSVYLLTVPVALMWAYMGLALSEADYDDERIWSFLAEIGAAERLEYRQNAYFVLITLPLASLGFYYFMKHTFLYWSIKNSLLLAMFRELYLRATGNM